MHTECDINEALLHGVNSGLFIASYHADGDVGYWKPADAEPGQERITALQIAAQMIGEGMAQKLESV